MYMDLETLCYRFDQKQAISIYYTYNVCINNYLKLIPKKFTRQKRAQVMY